MAKKLIRFDWAMKNMLCHKANFDIDEIKPNFSAKGLKEANEKLDAMKLPEKERKAYDAYLRHMMSIASRNHNIEIDAKEIIKKAKEEQMIEVIIEMHKDGVPNKSIAKYLKTTEERVAQIIESQMNK
jgi:hypothetical protein